MRNQHSRTRTRIRTHMYAHAHAHICTHTRVYAPKLNTDGELQIRTNIRSAIKGTMEAISMPPASRSVTISLISLSNKRPAAWTWKKKNRMALEHLIFERTSAWIEMAGR